MLKGIGELKRKRLDAALAVMILLGSIVLIVEVSYFVYRATGDEPLTPGLSAGISAGPTPSSLVGVRLPDRFAPNDTRVVGVILTHCDGGCEDNVPVWNALSSAGVGVVVVTRSIATDARLFRARTGARFPVIAFEGDDFLRRFSDSHFGWTLVLDKGGVVTHAYKGRLTDADSILHRLGAQ